MTKHAPFHEETGDVHVRIGTVDDLDGVMELAMMACNENALCAPNPQKLLETVYGALDQQNGICGVIGTPGEVIEGVVVLTIGSMWYSDDLLLEEKAIFVRPEYRSAKGGRAARLCEFSKLASEMLEMILTIGILSSTRTEAKVRMYSRMLGQPSGAYWIYGGRTGQVSSGGTA